jgi:hypothetical protein
MAGILKVDKYQDFNGNDIMTSDGSGNITLSSNMTTAVQAVGSANTPAFMASLGSNQTISGSNHLVECNTVLKDTNSAYTNTAGNYKFTVPSGEAGTYFLFCSAAVFGGGDNTVKNFLVLLYKNNSAIAHFSDYLQQTTARYLTKTGSIMLDLDVGDYIQLYTSADSSQTPTLYNQNYSTFFGGYKLIGV